MQFKLSLLKLLGPLLLMPSCVSIELGNQSVERAKDVKYIAPARPFQSFNPDNLDMAWKNEKNGNSISFLTDCGDRNDPPLEQVHSGVLASIRDVTLVKQDEIKYNGRAAIHSVVKGSVDGVASQFELMVFKKNSCIYIITYVALPETFEQNVGDFKKFLKSFEAP